jgi:hypothetical protein
MREAAKIVSRNLHQAGLSSARENTVLESAMEETREDRNDIDTHRVYLLSQDSVPQERLNLVLRLLLPGCTRANGYMGEKGYVRMLQKKLVLAHLALLPWLGCPLHLLGQSRAAIATPLTSIDNLALHRLAGPVPASQSLEPPAVTEPTKKQFTVRPFSTGALSINLSTLGPGIDLATPLARSLNLRMGVNFLNLGYGFHLDKMQYQPRVYLRSGHVSLHWSPRHGGFHISPGLMYQQNRLSAVTTAPAGTEFELGSQSFTSSVNDPVHGNASVVFLNQIAPILTLGFGNMIPRSGRHLSFPIEIGAAYTGAPKIDLALKGTACTTQGCFVFSQSQEAQSSLQHEIQKVNEDLKSFPVYPILSSGLAVRF